MPIRLALADSNNRYIEKLAAWIQKHMPYHFSIEVMTHPESFREWAENGGKADLTVISIDMAREVLPFLPKEGVLVLEDGSHEPLSPDTPRVDKYKPADELAKDILSLCADRMPGMHCRERHRQNVTLVVSLDGADAVFPAAPAITRVFTAMDRKTLYLSLEQAQTTRLFFSGSGSKGLNELLYYIKSNRDNLYMRLESCLIRDLASGVHFLSAPCGLLSPGAIDPADMERLLSAADSDGDFDEIVVALDLGMFHLIPMFMEKAARVIAVALNTASSSIRMERLLQELEKENIDTGKIKDTLRLLLIDICPSDGFSGRFADIQKYNLDPHPAQQADPGWVPSESELAALASIIESFDIAG